MYYLPLELLTQVRCVSKSSGVKGVVLEIHRARIGTFLARRPNFMAL
jgi:hypothetical protein